jgi:hypothetical protein
MLRFKILHLVICEHGFFCPVRLAGGWLAVLICSERKVEMYCCLDADKPNKHAVCRFEHKLLYT